MEPPPYFYDGGPLIREQKIKDGAYNPHHDPALFGHESASSDSEMPSFSNSLKEGLAIGTFITLIFGVPIGFGIAAVKYITNNSDKIPKAPIVGAVTIAAASAIAVGTYKTSNFIWKKITGENSPVKSTLTTAALFASVAVVGAQCEKYPAMGVAIDAQNHRVFTSEGLLRGDLNRQAMQKCQSAGGACVNLNEFRAGASGCAIYARLFDGRVAWDNLKGNPERTIHGFKERYNEQIDYGGVVCNNTAEARGMLAVVRKVFEIPPTAPAAPAPGP
jgi:hypothetical protein